MTAVQERAHNVIDRLPDDKLYYVVQLLEGLEGLVEKEDIAMPTVEQKAYAELQKFRKPRAVEIDYKAELAKARDEK